MLLTVFGIEPDEAILSVRYNVRPESAEFAAASFKRFGLTDRKVIGINVSPGEGTRFWGTDNYQALIRWLRSSFPDCPVLVLFQPSDMSVAKGITDPFDGVVLSPETRTFDQFAALVERLWILVTPDTSAVHLAAAFSVPSVVLYVQSDKDLRVWEPYGSHSEIVVTDVDDLQTIPVEHVVRAVDRLVKAIKPKHSAGAPSSGPFIP
jgi:ADP-heptose:LPS heptosyltransferase